VNTGRGTELGITENEHYAAVKGACWPYQPVARPRLARPAARTQALLDIKVNVS
jgi:hypothetical protein